VEVVNGYAIRTGTGFNLSDNAESSKVTLGIPAGEIVIDAASKITIKVGDSKIELTTSNVVIQVGGSKVELTSGAVTVDGTTIKLTGNKANSLELAGTAATLQGGAEVAITGPSGVKLNS
jgi:type VI secretion system secreted protein VgrG